jgi:tripartite-type tricarboxylate transporter receptor subunit TctC
VARKPNILVILIDDLRYDEFGAGGHPYMKTSPKAIITKLYQDTAQALKSPDIRTRFEQIGMMPIGNEPGVFVRAIKEESARWAKIIRERKLQVE